MRVAIYVRVSTSDQSTDSQLLEAKAYCASRGWNEPTIYEDHGISGAKLSRPKYNQLKEAIRRKQVDVLIVFKLDRLARSLRELVLLVEEMEALGVRLISLKEAIDLTLPTGRLMFGLISTFAQFERSIIAERVRAGMAAAKARGSKVGRPSPLDTAKVKEMRAQGKSLREIAKIVGSSPSAVSRACRKAG